MHKDMSVKARVNLFYIAIIAFMGIFICAVLLIVTDTELTNVSAATVESAVKESTEHISYHGDSIEIDPDFDFYNNNVTIVLYGPAGTPLAGSVPTGFYASTPLVTESRRKVQSDDETGRNWLVYDLYVRYSEETGIWIRGIFSIDVEILAVKSLITVTVIAVPIILILSLIFGRLITRRAFLPVSDMCESVKSISNGKDLSRRLILHDTKDEFYELGAEVNSMFERLEKAFENERQFASDVSHELKTPIAVILSQCEYIQSTNTATNDEYTTTIKTINEQGKRMSSLVTQLLELSRTFSIDATLSLEEFDLSELVLSIADEMQGIAAEKSIEIVCNAEQDIIVYADQMQIIRLIINLTSNAIRYGRDNGHVILTLERSSMLAKVCVEDDGIGIQPENLERVFEPFFKEDKSRKKTENSFGLGLSYVRQITAAHGGTINVTSTPGQGTRFVICLPIIKE